MLPIAEIAVPSAVIVIFGGMFAATTTATDAIGVDIVIVGVIVVIGTAVGSTIAVIVIVVAVVAIIANDVTLPHQFVLFHGLFFEQCPPNTIQYRSLRRENQFVLFHNDTPNAIGG